MKDRCVEVIKIKVQSRKNCQKNFINDNKLFKKIIQTQKKRNIHRTQSKITKAVFFFSFLVFSFSLNKVINFL